MAESQQTPCRTAEGPRASSASNVRRPSASNARDPLRAQHPVPPPDLAPLALLIAFAGTLAHASDAPLWRSDSALLAAGDPAALTGRVSSLLAQTFSILPLGSHTLRTTLLGSMASAWAAWLLTKTTRHLLAREGMPSRMDPWLSVAAALGVVFSLPWITEATIAGGGAAPGAALAIFLLGWLLKGEKAQPTTLKAATGFGVLLGLLGSESPWAALALSLFAAAQWSWPAQKQLVPATVSSTLLSAGLLVGPRALSLPPSALDAVALLPTEASWPSYSLIESSHHVGLLFTLGLLSLALFFRGDKRLLLGAATIVGLDWLVPAPPLGSWMEAVEARPARTALHLLALATVAPLGAWGLRRLAGLIRGAKLAGSPQIAALLTLLAVAGAVAGIEDASRRLSQTHVAGPRAWTQAALHPLPHRAMVLTHSAPVSRRLLAAQKQGERPDVLVVPFDALPQASKLSSFLRQEPALKQLIVDLSVGQHPSERALSQLAEQRPVYVEPHSDWDRRLLEHLHPTLPLARYSVHAIGRSERLSSLKKRAPEIASIVEATEEGLHPDEATRRILETSVEETRKILEAIGDGPCQRALDDAAPPRLAQRALLSPEDS